MQLLIRHKLSEPLELPLGYHHIIQAIIYKGLGRAQGYSTYIHDEGAVFGQRNYKLFTFGPLRGKYRIIERKIIFYDQVEFEVRSPDVFMIRRLAENLERGGIQYGKIHISDVEVLYSDFTVERDEIRIQMLSPISVYSSDMDSRRTYFYSPEEEEFPQLINENFIRKYTACYHVPPDSGIYIESVSVTPKDKYVTRYKDFYITGWKGEYYLCGKRKYLDFLYQAGLGSKNSQGFGMFEI